MNFKFFCMLVTLSLFFQNYGMAESKIIVKNQNIREVKVGKNIYILRDKSGKKLGTNVHINHKNKYDYGKDRDEI